MKDCWEDGIDVKTELKMDCDVDSGYNYVAVVRNGFLPNSHMFWKRDSDIKSDSLHCTDEQPFHPNSILLDCDDDPRDSHVRNLCQTFNKTSSTVDAVDNFEGDYLLNSVYKSSKRNDFKTIKNKRLLTKRYVATTKFFLKNNNNNSGHSKKLCNYQKYAMLDGALEESSSDASFSSESSTSSTSGSESESEDGETTEEDEEEEIVKPQKTRKSTTPESSGGRRLRTRDKSEKKEEKKTEVKCPKCGKAFQSKASVNRHSRWCKPKPGKIAAGIKRTSSSSSTVESNSSSSGPTTSSSSTTTMKRGRGRPPKRVKIDDDDFDVDQEEKLSSSTSESATISTKRTGQRKLRVIESEDSSNDALGEQIVDQSMEPVASTSKSYNQDKHVHYDVAAGSNNLQEFQGYEDDEQPKTCDKCKLTYRTVASFRKHLPNCISYTSSSDDEEKYDDHYSQDADSQTLQTREPSSINVSKLQGGNESVAPQDQQSTEVENATSNGHNSVIEVIEEVEKDEEEEESIVTDFTPVAITEQQNVDEESLDVIEVGSVSVPNDDQCIVNSVPDDVNIIYVPKEEIEQPPLEVSATLEQIQLSQLNGEIEEPQQAILTNDQLQQLQQQIFFFQQLQIQNQLDAQQQLNAIQHTQNQIDISQQIMQHSQNQIDISQQVMQHSQNQIDISQQQLMQHSQNQLDAQQQHLNAQQQYSQNQFSSPPQMISIGSLPFSDDNTDYAAMNPETSVHLNSNDMQIQMNNSSQFCNMNENPQIQNSGIVVDNGGVTYILVQQGNTFSTIPINSQMLNSASSCPSLPPTMSSAATPQIINFPQQQEFLQQQQLNIPNHVMMNQMPQRQGQLNTSPVMMNFNNFEGQNMPVIGDIHGQGLSATLPPLSSTPQTQDYPGVPTINDASNVLNESALLKTKPIVGKKSLKPIESNVWGGAVGPKRGGGARVDNKHQVQRPQSGVWTIGGRPVPKILPAVTTSPVKIDYLNSSVPGIPGGSNLSCATHITATQGNIVPTVSISGKVPISSPNIAVVRPLEHPLQKISHQISQIGVNVNSSTSLHTNNLQQPASHIPMINNTSIITSATDSIVNNNSLGERNITLPVPTTIDTTVFSQGEDSTKQEFLMHSSNIPQAMEEGNITVENLKDVIYDSGQQIDHRGDSVASQKSEESKPTSMTGKSIKVTLKRKEGGDSYSINYQSVKDIKESGLQTAGNMRSLKIRAKITSGEQAGMSTDVVVLPVVQTIPIISELKINSDDENCKRVKFDESHVVKPGLNAECVVKNPLRLTHKAVIVYEVKCQGVLLFRSSDVRAVWDNIFETVQGTRLQHNLPPLAYPATNISLPDDERDAASFNRLGLTHRAVQFLLEQLPGTNSVVEKHKFRFHQPTTDEEPLLPVNESGCARTEGFKTRKPFDMFGWLASRQRAVPATIDNPSDWGRQDLPIAMRYRNLREKASNSLGVFYSTIHGRGLFTRREYVEGEIIIEYAGELIRAVLSDRREKYYESRGIGCYFFTIDEKVVIDATVKGNAARFINHSCDPNCRSKIVEILGKKRILIFAIRKILGGEELTYDYKFDIEGTDKKISCSCGAKKCRKYLN